MDSSRGFNVKAAGSAVKMGAGSVVSHFEHEKIAPVTRVTTANGNWTGGQEIHFRVRSSSGRWWVPKMSKIMVEMKITQHGTTTGAPASVRLVTCPVSQLFSSARVVFGNTNVETRGSHYGLVSQFNTRNAVDRFSGITAGSGSLLDFDDTMVADDGSVDKFNVKDDGTEETSTGQLGVGSVPQRRNLKQDILATAGGHAFTLSEGINLDVLNTDAWIPGVEADIYLMVNEFWQEDMLYSRNVNGQAQYERGIKTTHGHVDFKTNAMAAPVRKVFDYTASAGGGSASGNKSLTVEILNVHYMAKFARPQQGILKVPSMQIVYETTTFMERTLAQATSDFEETFNVPPGVRAVCVFSREKLNSIEVDNALFGAAGGGHDTVAGAALKTISGVGDHHYTAKDGAKTLTRSRAPFRRLQCELGGIHAPTLEFSGVDFPNLKASRVWDTYLSFMHDCEASHALAGDYKEFCRSPVFFLHLMQRPGTSASVLTVRGTFGNGSSDPSDALKSANHTPGAQQQLCVALIHGRVCELKYGASEDTPAVVTVQPLL